MNSTNATRELEINITECYARRLLAHEYNGEVPRWIPVDRVLALMQKMVELESQRNKQLEKQLLDLYNVIPNPPRVV
jgi:hypothetical protein